MPSHFCICILPSERPLDATLLRVPAQLPGIHFCDDRGLIRQTPIKALAIKNADFDFSHVEPTGMFWSVVKDNTSQQRICLLDTEHLRNTYLWMMGVGHESFCTLSHISKDCQPHIILAYVR